MAKNTPGYNPFAPTGGSPYFAGGGGGGSPYFGGGGGSPYLAGGDLGGAVSGVGLKVNKPAGHHGLLGLVENLGGDVAHTAAGIPGAVAAVAKASYEDAVHPTPTPRVYTQIVKPAAKQTAQEYGPLAHGDVHAFLSNLYQHPLGPVLDLLTVLSVGAGGAAKAARLAERAGADGKLVKAAAKLDRPAEITLRSPGALAGQDNALTIVKETSGRPLRKAGQLAVDKALKQLSPETRIVGEFARFGRELDRLPAKDAARLRLKGRDYMAAYADLSRKERVALGVLGRVPLPEHLDAWRAMLARQAKRGTGSAADLLKVLDDPQVQELYARPTEAMLRAHAAADELGQVASEVLAEKGALDPQAAAEARYRHSRIAAGATVYSAKDAKRAVRGLDRDLRRLTRDQQRIGEVSSRLRSRGTPEARQLRADATATAQQGSRVARARQRVQAATDRADSLHEQLSSARADLERLASGREITSDELLAAGLKPGSDLAGVRAKLLGRAFNQVERLADQYDRALATLQRRAGKLPSADSLASRRASEHAAQRQVRSDIASRLAAGRNELQRLADLEGRLRAERAQVHPGIVGVPVDELRAQIEAAGRPQPLYLPDTAAIEKRATGRGRGRDATAIARAPVHRSEGVLFRTGQLALEPDTLSPEFLRTVAFSYARDLHERLLESAERVPKGTRLPKGWTYVRRAPGEKIGYRERTGGIYTDSLAGLIENPHDLASSELNRQGLTDKTGKDALEDHGHRYIVPERLAKQVAGEAAASSNALVQFFDKATTVWRALVLGYRPAFLVNNVVGNQLLYALRFAGVDGLRAYLHALQEAKGGAAVRRLLNRSDTPKGISQQFMAEFFPEQVEGTFGNTQGVVSHIKSPKLRKAAERAQLGLIPATQAASEGLLRRAGVETALRRTPEVRAILKTMPAQTRRLEAAARQAIETDPRVADRVSSEVDAALGSYGRLGPFERKVVRRALPFYAWYKAIATITLRLPVDLPGRTNLLARLAEIGNEQQQDNLGGPVESFLEGAIPLGGRYGPAGSRQKILTTNGLNPFSTVAQEEQVLSALATGHGGSEAANELLGTLNPAIAGSVQSIAGALNGRPTGGVIPDVATNVAESLPLVRLLHPQNPKPGTPTRYDQSTLNNWAAFLGIPVKDLNVLVERQKAAKQP